MRQQLLTGIGFVLAGLFIVFAANGGAAGIVGGLLAAFGALVAVVAVWELAKAGDERKP